MEQIQGVISIAGKRKALPQKECSKEIKAGMEREGKHGYYNEKMQDGVCVEFSAQSKNESFARMVAAAYVAQLNPTLEELSDIKTAVSEAVTNAIIHGYGEESGMICMRLAIQNEEVCIEVEDWGAGIIDVVAAMEPMYTTRPDMERSGMGFAFMEAFMDELFVCSQKNCGTLVRMKKKISRGVADGGGSEFVAGAV